MKLKHTVIAAAMAAAAAPAFAGDFTELPQIVFGSNTSLVTGANNPNNDRLYLSATAVNVLDVVGVPDGTLFSSIDYTAISHTGPAPRPVLGSGTLTLLDYRFTADIELPGEDDPIGHLYDFVFRDSRDNKLVFGTRVTLGVEADQADDAELNFMYRYGFEENGTTFAAAAGWLFTGDYDLRLYNAGRTASDSLTGATPYDADTIRFQSDVNLSEGNPFSGLYLIKTDAEYYTLGDRAIGVFQAGEEGQPRVGADFAGFVPTAVNPVPEPSTYALMGLGLAGIAALARRRRNSSKA